MGNSERNYDASFCSTVPLHTTNAIQPHAALLVVGVTDFRVIQISANVCDWFEMKAESILNAPLDRFVEQGCVDTIKARQRRSFLKFTVSEYITFIPGKHPTTYLARIHEKDGYLLIEVEFINGLADKKPFVNPYQRLQEITVAINLAASIEELARVACQEIKRISGFDKVMIYAFDQMWNGLVIGEEMEAGMESYMGLKFPASDVPRQARDLYLKNSYRSIPDRKYNKVSLIPELNPLTNGPTNLMDVKSRSVLDVHLEYLGNMKVEASMSTRIIHNESLWGLIACHHRQPKYLTFEECTVFEMMSNIMSSKLSSLVNQSRLVERMRLNALLSEISGKITIFDKLGSVLKNHRSEITQLLGGDGIAVCWEGEIITAGVVPQDHQLQVLIPWLRENGFKKVVDITSLPDAFEPAKQYAAVASGILILPVQPYEGNFILAFKMEAVKTVSWGGNPDNAITFEKDFATYHPRHSFAIWKETVRQTSNPWSEEELIAAERFRNIVVESTLKKMTSTLERKVNERTAQLEVSNKNLARALEELQELTHVTSHDLQEPVRKMALYASELDKPLEAGKKQSYIDKIVKASRRISSLITDLVSISKATDNKVFEKCDLQVVLNNVLRRFQESISDNHINVLSATLPTVDAVPEQMELLFTKVIDNAIKFRSQEGQSRIEISAAFVASPSIDAPEDRAGKFVRISVMDNGIGFNNKYADKLFRVFETLHPGQYEGTGSSLAIAKRIVESHGGKIFAHGEENEGAIFVIILPTPQS